MQFNIKAIDKNFNTKTGIMKISFAILYLFIAILAQTITLVNLKVFPKTKGSGAIAKDEIYVTNTNNSGIRCLRNTLINRIRSEIILK